MKNTFIPDPLLHKRNFIPTLLLRDKRKFIPNKLLHPKQPTPA